MVLATPALNRSTRPSEFRWNSRSNYQEGPSLQAVAGGAAIERGHGGREVQSLQRLLNEAGVTPRLDEDGLFGPKTQAAVRQLQQRLNLPQSGRIDANTLAGLQFEAGNRRPHGLADRFSARRQGNTPQAPAYGRAAPQGTIPFHQLKQREDSGRHAFGNRTQGNTGPNAVAPTITGGAGDQELARLQRATMNSARGELAAGVRERGSSNRSERVDQYARRAGMPVGGAWCGYFSSFNYSEAARANGGEFAGRHHMHSFQKARSFFQYRSYTNNSRATNQRLDSLRQQHGQAGSQRRFMVLEGSGGQRHASRRNRPHEVFQPNTLPIREGDTALYSRGHVGLVESYDRNSGMLTTIEGNTSGGRVARKTYNLNDPSVRAQFEGFGRPALSDFQR